MTTRKSDFRKYLDQTKSLPEDTTLGQLVVFTVRDAQYDMADCELAFDELGLNPGLLPFPNNPLHAFMKATSSVNDTDYDLGGDRTAHVLVRELSEDKTSVVRQFTREVRDSHQRRLGYSRIGECVFYRPTTTGGKVQYGTERIRLTIDNAALLDGERKVLSDLVATVQREYDRHVRFMDAQKLRGVVRKYLEHLNALKVKDGLYFVHTNRTDELAKLQALVSRMGGGSSLFTIPLVDLDNTRTMLLEAYETEAEEMLTDVVKAVAHVRGTRGRVTPDAYAKIKRQYDNAISRSNEFARTLKLRNVTLGGAEELALESLAALQDDLLGASA